MTHKTVVYKYGTGNPVEPNGSGDVRDGIDNLQSFDVFMNAEEDTYNQRDGEVVRTISGMNSEFDAHILNMGFTRVGTFASGATLTNPRQTLLWEASAGGDGQEYGWSGAFDKVVPPNSTPLSTGGIAVGAWISRFDPELSVQVREAIRRGYASSGYALVAGSFEAGGTVATSSDVVLFESNGRAYAWGGPLPKSVPAGSTPDNSGGVGPGAWSDVSHYISPALTRSQLISWASNQSIVNGAVIEGDGLKYRKVDGSTAIPDFPGFEPDGDVSIRHWGALGGGIADDTSGMKSAITYCATNGRILHWQKGKYRFTSISVNIAYGNFHWVANGKVELICTNDVATAGQAIRLSGVASPTLHYFTTKNISLGEKRITLDGTSDITANDLIVIRNNHVVRGDNRGSWQEGQIAQVVSLSGNDVILDQDAYYYYRSGGNITVTVTSATSGQSFSASAFSVTNPPRDALYKLRGLTGANTGVTKMTTKFDDATKTFTVGIDSGTGFPSTPAVGDTFLLLRQAEAWAVYPATFNIVGDFHVKPAQGMVTNATPGQSAYSGMVFNYCVNGVVAISSVENFPDLGILFYGCLRCTVRDTSLYGINRVFDGDGGTGDAISLTNSSYCTVDNINVGSSRRGVDVAGSSWSSLYNTVKNVTMRGGGTGYTGEIIFPSEGWTQFSYGWGSHAGAVGTKYKDNTAIDCYYGITLRGFSEINSDCEIMGLCNLPIRLYYGSGITITDTHYTDGFTETTATSTEWWIPTSSATRKLRPSAFILMTNTYTFETPTIIKGCSAKSTTREFVAIDTYVAAPDKIDGVSISGCTVYVDNSDNTSGSTDAYFLRINGGPALGDNFGLGGGNQLILVGTDNTVVSGKLFHASGTCEGAIRKSEGVWEVWCEANTSQSFPVGRSNQAFCVDVINDGTPDAFAGLNMIIIPGSAADGSPFAPNNRVNLEIHSVNMSVPGKVGISVNNGRLYFNNGTATDVRAIIRVATV